MAPLMVVGFGECVFDGAARELRRRGQVVPLSPRAFQLLALLLDARPRALSHEQLHRALWPDSFVGYSSLAQVVAELRRAIGDRSLVRTLPRFGYAFAQEPGHLPSPPAVIAVLVGDDREHAIPEGETLVGRGTECGVRVPSARVSRVHARIGASSEGIWIEDAGSKNGTWVNGEPRAGRVALSEGDRIRLGGCHFVLARVDAGSTHTMASRTRRTSHG